MSYRVVVTDIYRAPGASRSRPVPLDRWLATQVTDAAPPTDAAQFRALHTFLDQPPARGAELRDRSDTVIALWLEEKQRWAVDWPRITAAYLLPDDRVLLDSAAGRPIPMRDVIGLADRLGAPHTLASHYTSGQVEPVADEHTPTGRRFTAQIGDGDELRLLSNGHADPESALRDLHETIKRLREQLHTALLSAADPTAARVAYAQWEPPHVRTVDHILIPLRIVDIAQACGVKRKTVDVWRDRYNKKNGTDKLVAFPDPDFTDPPSWLPDTIAAWCAATGREFDLARLEDDDYNAEVPWHVAVKGHLKLMALVPKLMAFPDENTPQGRAVVEEIESIHADLGHERSPKPPMA